MARTHGSKNKFTINDKECSQHIKDKIRERIGNGEYLDPLEYLMEILSDETDMPERLRMQAAEKLLPYFHQQLPKPVEHTGADGGPIEFDYGDSREALENVLSTVDEEEPLDETVH